MTTLATHVAPRRAAGGLVGGLILLAVLAWAATIYQAKSMSCGMCSGMSVACPMCMGTGKSLWVSLPLFLGMWATMMAAMMLPSVTPMVLLFDQVSRGRVGSGGRMVTWVFVAGYLVAWALLGFLGFGVARMVQWCVGVWPGVRGYTGVVTGITLIAAGIYQLSPLKRACLRHCQSPLSFVLTKWREGRWGAVRMGSSHGLYCMGCCWGLMVVLFAVGLMNLTWMAGLTVVMSVEKMSRWGEIVGRVSGVGLIVFGAASLIR